MIDNRTTGGSGQPGPATSAATPRSQGKPADPDPDPSALARCTGLDAAGFADRYWSREPLLSRAAGTGADFSDLLSAAAVDELVSRRGMRTPFLRMAKAGSVLPASSFTRSGGTGASIGDQVADDKVLEQIAGGATLVLQALHRTWPPLVAFGTELAAELSHPVQINAYVTPPESQGFAPHYDTHDVFVLQVTGRKHWLVHEPVVPAPLPEQQWEKHRDAVTSRSRQAPAIEVTLEPGDVLYLPRGYLHSATALGELSIHLTVGVHPVTRYTLIRELVAAAAADPELRGSLPMGVDLSDPAVLAPWLAQAAEALTRIAADPDHEQLSRVAERVGAELTRNTRPAPIAPLAQAALVASLTDDTPFQLRPGLRVNRQREHDALLIRFLDKEISLPPAMQPALELILTGRALTAADLPELSSEEQLGLARRLLREAVTVPECAVLECAVLECSPPEDGPGSVPLRIPGA
ncbi:MAG: bifunctional lysine-specific demethylase and histidyl-hydroxylase [Pseudonocardiales bacterium]|nr:bifunctional lysine-specific demethylase and histidyl-hydroxylase [Pseudonocardiales bacterium]